MAKEKTVILLYGERTKQLNVRVPESKYEVIRDEINGLLRKYENPSLSATDVSKGIVEQIAKKPFLEGTQISAQDIEEATNFEVVKTLDEVYDCVIVSKGIPDEADRVYASPRTTIAFWDRYDNPPFYLFWDNIYYRFANSKEFNKCLKDKSIK